MLAQEPLGEAGIPSACDCRRVSRPFCCVDVDDCLVTL